MPTYSNFLVGSDIQGDELLIAGEVQGAILYRNATGWVVLTPGTSGQVLNTKGAAANPEWAAAGAGEGNITLYPWHYESVGNGTWVFNFDTGRLHSMSSGTDAAQLVWKAYLAAGTYTILLRANVGSSYGIGVLNFDSTDHATFDTYNAGSSDNNRFEQTSVTVSTGGLKTITWTTTGKNASSSNYNNVFSQINLFRTA